LLLLICLDRKERIRKPGSVVTVTSVFSVFSCEASSGWVVWFSVVAVSGSFSSS